MGMALEGGGQSWCGNIRDGDFRGDVVALE